MLNASRQLLQDDVATVLHGVVAGEVSGFLSLFVPFLASRCPSMGEADIRPAMDRVSSSLTSGDPQAFAKAFAAAVDDAVTVNRLRVGAGV